MSTEKSRSEQHQAQLNSIDVVAQRLGVSSFTVRRFVKAGALKAVKVGRRLLISEATVQYVVEHGMQAIENRIDG
jgi:excisionase family DNA binding protein